MTAPMKPLTAQEGLAIVLSEWAAWHCRDRGVDGFPAASNVCTSGYCSASFEDLCVDADEWRSMVVDCCVDELVPAQRAAIMREYGIAAVFRFPRNNFAEMLDLAHKALLTSLPRKGIAIPGLM